MKSLAELAKVSSKGAGVQNKPKFCYSNCPLCYSRTGFVEDDKHRGKVGFLLKAPMLKETLQSTPWTGPMGYMWQKSLLEEIGFERSDVGIYHVLRCGSRTGYPTGGDGTRANKACRHFDKHLLAFDPNMFVATLDPEKIISAPPFMTLIRFDITKAFQLAEDGYRPLVLLGKEVLHTVAPWLKGGIKDWRGTFWEGALEFKQPAPTFAEAKNPFRRRRK